MLLCYTANELPLHPLSNIALNISEATPNFASPKHEAYEQNFPYYHHTVNSVPSSKEVAP